MLFSNHLSAGQTSASRYKSRSNAALLAVLTLLSFHRHTSMAVSFTTVAPLAVPIGSQPSASLLLGQNGRFYGTAASGGTFGHGALFVLSLPNTLSNLVSFNGANGSQPLAGLIQATNNGDLLGTTFSGGTSNLGTIFRIGTNGSFAWVFSFNGSNGSRPEGPLIQALNNRFLGTTTAGGSNGAGTVFAVDATGANLTTLATFGGTNGSGPIGTIVQMPDGTIYGTTSSGGDLGSGTIFRITAPPEGALQTVYSFHGVSDGAGPQAGLVLGPDGSLYGTTAGGGGHDTASGGDGTIFRFTPPSSFTSLYSFDNATGARPYAPLTAGLNGFLLGTTRDGGAHLKGTVFNVSTTGVLTNFHSFQGGSDGAAPLAGLTAGTNGVFYGVASAAGKNSDGTVFAISAFSPFVVTQSLSQKIVSGSTVSLSVAAGGTAPLSYQWQTNSVNLPENSHFFGTRTATLTINNVTAADAGNYAVVIQNSSGVVTSSNIVLTVIDRPGLTISSPKNNSVVTKSTFTASGRTSGSVGVAHVFYQLNGGGWQLANSSDGYLHWTAVITAPPGTNVFQAYAESIISTISPTNTVTFICNATSAPISLTINGQGTVSPIYNGQLLQIGTAYSVTAKPASGWLFADWSGTTNATGTKLSFVMESNFVVVANFVEKPFEEVRGNYQGLFDVGAGHDQSSSGLATLSIAESGKFTGTLRIGASRYSFRGTFETNGAGSATIINKSGLLFTIDLTANLTPGPHHIFGTITGDAFSASLDLVKAVFNSKSNPAPLMGQYTFYFSGTPGSDGLPRGNSYGTIRIDGSGNVRLGGSLADGTAISDSTIISADGLSPIYIPLYKGQGSLYTWLSFTNTTNSPVSGIVAWIKPAISKEKFYPNGFSLTAELIGSKYAKLAIGGVLVPATTYQLRLSGDDLSADIVAPVELDTAGHAHVTDGSKTKLSFSTSNGTLSGSVTDPNTLKLIKFKGVVLQNQSVGTGYFPGYDALTGIVDFKVP
jgi:uncharacterized repeat protein (TIGR03803 family)